MPFKPYRIASPIDRFQAGAIAGVATVALIVAIIVAAIVEKFRT